MRIIHLVLAIFFGIGQIACSSIAFNRAWKADEGSGSSECAICGKWAGTWVSEANGHHGKLRGIISRNADGTYRARYHATYAKIFWYATEATLHPAAPAGEENPERVYLKGEEDLGRLFGVYEYDGYATQEEYVIRYKAKKDHGINRMTRILETGPQRPRGGSVSFTSALNGND